MATQPKSTRSPSKSKSTIDSVRDKLPAATTRNVAIGAAAAATAVGVGLAATVGRKRIVKASGDLVAGIKRTVADAHGTKPDEGELGVG